MDTLKLRDATEICFKDLGQGHPMMYHHGWPVSADDWAPQRLFFLERGFRVIAHDQRGHRSTGPSPSTTWTPTPATRRS